MGKLSGKPLYLQSLLAFYSDDPSSNPTEVYSVYSFRKEVKQAHFLKSVKIKSSPFWDVTECSALQLTDFCEENRFAVRDLRQLVQAQVDLKKTIHLLMQFNLIRGKVIIYEYVSREHSSQG